MPDYLHNHKDFPALLRIVGQEMDIIPGLVEKDYWIMHTLYGLKKQGYTFELKGGTSLSKGYNFIHRFSEDIDIHIKPSVEMGINENPKKNKPANIEKRKNFYDWLTGDININGIVSVVRDQEFDDSQYYRSGGIRLKYNTVTEPVAGMKEGILLEAGFDTVTPNSSLTISSWAYEKAIQSNVPVIDNRAIEVACYNPGYTLVEKLQTIATKFRQEQEDDAGLEKQNLMRQYYDVYCLLNEASVQAFIGTEEYHTHKKTRFPAKDFEIPIAKNEAFVLKDDKRKARFEERYKKTAALYYQGQPEFIEVIARIGDWVEKL